MTMSIASELGRRAGMLKVANDLPGQAPTGGSTNFGASAPATAPTGNLVGGGTSPNSFKLSNLSSFATPQGIQGLLPALGPVIKPILGATGGAGLLGLTDAMHGFNNIRTFTQGKF
jgi:hypothetical protein